MPARRGAGRRVWHGHAVASTKITVRLCLYFLDGLAHQALAHLQEIDEPTFLIIKDDTFFVWYAITIIGDVRRLTKGCGSQKRKQNTRDNQHRELRHEGAHHRVCRRAPAEKLCG